MREFPCVLAARARRRRRRRRYPCRRLLIDTRNALLCAPSHTLPSCVRIHSVAPRSSQAKVDTPCDARPGSWRLFVVVVGCVRTFFTIKVQHTFCLGDTHTHTRCGICGTVQIPPSSAVRPPPSNEFANYVRSNANIVYPQKQKEFRLVCV